MLQYHTEAVSTAQPKAGTPNANAVAERLNRMLKEAFVLDGNPSQESKNWSKNQILPQK